MGSKLPSKTSAAARVVVAQVRQGGQPSEPHTFSGDFLGGSGPTCELYVAGPTVAAEHFQVLFDGMLWWVRDLATVHGTLIDGRRIQMAPLSGRLELQLGASGPRVELELTEAAAPPRAAAPRLPPAPRPPAVAAARTEPALRAVGVTDTQLIEDFFQKPEEGAARAAELLGALQRVRRRTRRSRRALLGALGLILCGLALIAYQRMRALEQDRKIARLQATSEDLFYNAKTLEVQIAALEDVVMASASARQLAELNQTRAQLQEMEKRYNAFVQELGLYEKLPPDERLMLRIARKFGECDVNVPSGFLPEVHRYVEVLRSRDFFPRALRRAKDQYAQPIAEEFVKNRLPPQYLYLALQESGFDERAVGPPTAIGFAKGMWQFIAPTAHDFGLSTGPLAAKGDYDPGDERFDWRKETAAAARYLHNLNVNYTQNSGLLAMASYNWGEGRVRAMIDAMPKNARERNFWRLLTLPRVPAETYDYVLSIFTMAVVCEDPKLFGFSVECPVLADPAEAGPPERRLGG